MVRHRLDSLSDLARKGYDVRIVCRACGHAVTRQAAEMIVSIAGTGGTQQVVERHIALFRPQTTSTDRPTSDPTAYLDSG